jgi:hypothetical protein
MRSRWVGGVASQVNEMQVNEMQVNEMQVNDMRLMRDLLVTS